MRNVEFFDRVGEVDGPSEVEDLKDRRKKERDIWESAR